MANALADQTGPGSQEPAKFKMKACSSPCLHQRQSIHLNGRSAK